MRILHLVPAMNEGGVERYVTTLNRLLTEAGHENIVVSSGGALAKVAAAEGGRHIELDLRSKNPLTAIARARALGRLLAAERPEVVVAHSRVPAWLYVLAARSLADRPRFLTYAHGANSVSAYSKVMTRGDLVMAPSAFIREYLMNAYGTPAEKFRVVPHGVDAFRFDPAKLDTAFVEEKRREWGIAPGMKVVMAIGRITPVKGFETLLKAFSLFADPSLRLVIVGGASADKAAYFESLRSAAPAGTVFAGYQSKTAECLELADVVVSSNTAKPESFGLSMAEALAMGRPVVAKGFGGALDIVRDGVDGVLVKEGSPEKFAAAIGKALETPWDRSRLREDALGRFSLSRMLSLTLSAYAEAVRKS